MLNCTRDISALKKILSFFFTELETKSRITLIVKHLNSSYPEDAVNEDVSVLEEDSNYIKLIQSYNYYIYCYGFSSGNQEAFTLRAQKFSSS